MLHLDCIGIEVKSQGYEGKGIQVAPDGQEAVLIMEKRSGERRCPACGHASYINDTARMQLKDVPIFAGSPRRLLSITFREEPKREDCENSPQTVKKAMLSAAVIRRLQDSHRIARLCRAGGAFSVAKCSFAEENIHQLFSQKWLCHFCDTLGGL